tara:strand:- start:555 stop:773 length:219 start_codon:yes stop_codon:yes gene_type:complete
LKTNNNINKKTESKTMKVISKNELLKFCDRLEEHKELSDGGHLEHLIANAKEEAINKVGDLLREFLESEEIK